MADGMNEGRMNGGMALVNTLIEWGVDTAFFGAR